MFTVSADSYSLRSIIGNSQSQPPSWALGPFFDYPYNSQSKSPQYGNHPNHSLFITMKPFTVSNVRIMILFVHSRQRDSQTDNVYAQVD